MVKRRAVPIRRGDIIMIAGRYQLNWNQINTFFPPTENSNLHRGMEYETPVQQALRAASSPNVDLSKWNWGAFGLYGLWGFFNGCWWAFLIALFIGWLFPIPNIIFGVFGTRWAWENRSWLSPEDFMQTQESWSIWGIIVTCLNVVLLFFWPFWWISFISRF